MKERGHSSLLSIFSSDVPLLVVVIFPLLPPSCISSSLLFFSLLIRPLDCSKLLSASPWEGGGVLESVLIKI